MSLIISSMVAFLNIALTYSDPYMLKSLYREKNIIIIIEHAYENDADPFELLAIAITESFLNERA